VGRLSQEELMAQLPSFLPALFEAFGNQSADVRKVFGSFICIIYGSSLLTFLKF
jgi:CLIP-associating protein 1/2